MGFFSNLKDMVTDTIASNQGQSESQASEVVKKLLDMQQIKENVIIKSVLENYEEYSKIGFGIESSVNQQNIYNCFRIPLDEIIVAIMKGKEKGLSLAAIDKVVLTDKALYILPEFATARIGEEDALEGENNNRFLLDRLCRFFLSYDDSCGKTYFENAFGVYPIVQRDGVTSVVAKVTSKFNADDSLYAIIRKIQRVSYQYCDIARSDRNSLADWICERAKVELEEGMLSLRTRQLIYVLQKESDYVKKMNFLFLEDAIHLFDEVTMKRTIEELLEICDEEYLCQWIDEKTSEYCEKLKNPDVMNATEFLELVCADFYIKDTEHEECAIENNTDNKVLNYVMPNLNLIRGYLAVRKYSCEDLSEIEKFLDEKMIDKENGERIIAISLYLRNRRMLQVYESIKNEGKLKEEWMYWRDSFGLTPLHYGILLKNDKMVKKLLKYYYTIKVGLLDLDEEIAPFYDFVMLAVVVGKEDYANEILELVPEIAPLRKSQKLLKAKKVIYSMYLSQVDATISVGKDKMRDAKKQGATNEQLYGMNEQLKNAKENRATKQDSLDNIEQDIFEIEQEIQSVKEAIIEESMDFYNRIETEEYTLSKLFHSLFTSSEKLYELLNLDFSMFAQYEVYGEYFFIPKDYIDKENDEQYWQKARSQSKNSENYQKNTTKEDDGIQRKEKWFSDNAYKDIDVLRKEYHILVSKYHPDNNPGGLKIFLEIQKERADILEGLSE